MDENHVKQAVGDLYLANFQLRQQLTATAQELQDAHRMIAKLQQQVAETKTQNSADLRQVGNAG